MRKTIVGYVIRIVDPKTIIVNLGHRDGIMYDSVFSILGEPEIITDPLTGDKLGEVTVIKGRAKASQVEEKFTIATTKYTQSYKGGGITYLSSIMDDVQVLEFDEALRVKEQDLQPWKARSEEYVRIGDPVEVMVDVQDEKAVIDDNSKKPDA